MARDVEPQLAHDLDREGIERAVIDADRLDMDELAEEMAP